MIDYEVCSEAYLRNINQVDPRKLSLEEDVFHIIGRPDQIWFNENYCEILKYKTQALYELIEKKGGNYVKSEDSNKITCVIYGAQPSVRTIEYFKGKVKLISAENAVMWLEKQKDYNPACRVFGKKYKSSEDTRLRPYQQLIKNRVFKIWNSQYNVMVQLPTGTGKTVLFTSIIKDLTKLKRSKIVILAHRKELIEQISEHLSHYNIEHGLITSGKVRRLDLSVQVASVQTLTHEKNIELLKELNPQFIIIDEAHHSLADTYTKFWKECGECWKLGVTATPYRLNLHSFRTHFDKYIESDTIEDFIKNGYLVDYDFYTDNPNSSLSRTIESIKEKSSTRDYNTAALLRALNVQKHIQRLIVCYEQYVKGKKGIVYAINKEHAHNICNAYQIIGVQAVYVDSDTPKLERQKIVEQFRNNEIQVMVNVDIFSEGFDCPDVEFIQLARPTWSLGKYLQQVGRGMRPSNNKQKTVILDNARMFVKFGFPSDKRSWISFFNGEYWLKDYQGKEDANYLNYLQQSDAGDDDMMIMPYRGNRRKDKSIIVQTQKDEENAALFRRIQIINYQARLNEIKEKKAAEKRKEEEAKKEARRLEKKKYLIEHTPKEIVESPYFDKVVTVCGDFSGAIEGEARYIIKSLGAIVRKSITNNSEIAFIGKYAYVDWKYLEEELGLHLIKCGNAEMNAAIKLHDKIYSHILNDDLSSKQSPFYNLKVAATGQLSWLLKDCNQIRDLFSLSGSMLCNENEEEADIYLLGLSTDLKLYYHIKEKIERGEKILLISYDEIDNLRNIQNLILTNILSLKPAFSEEIINYLSVYTQKRKIYTNLAINFFESERGIRKQDSINNYSNSVVLNTYQILEDSKPNKENIISENFDKVDDGYDNYLTDNTEISEAIKDEPRTIITKENVIPISSNISDIEYQSKEPTSAQSLRERNEAVRRRRREEREAKQRAYEELMERKAQEEEEYAREQQQKKIFATLGAVAIMLVLIYFFGLLGPAVFGLLAMGLLKK
jgi:superfamily II DNA or RNA helicase